MLQLIHAVHKSNLCRLKLSCSRGHYCTKPVYRMQYSPSAKVLRQQSRQQSTRLVEGPLASHVIWCRADNVGHAATAYVTHKICLAYA
jgi:hypothetical protein